MANPNPVRKGDYRKVKPETVKLWTRDLMIWLARYCPPEGITAPEIAERFGIPKADASARLAKLKVWHCMRIVSRGKGSTPYTWQVTPWGIKCAARWEKEKKS